MVGRLIRVGCATSMAAGALALAAPAAADGCPDGQVADGYSGECIYDMMADSWQDNEEGMQMFGIYIGPTYSGGQVPSVNGIPCTPEHVGTCIGLSQNQPSRAQPHSTISHSP